MEFRNISNQTDCTCLLNTVENTCDVFVRKVRKAPDLKDADFRNHIERSKVPKNKLDCDEVCGLNGLSIEIWNENSWDVLLKKYGTTSDFAPKGSNNLCVIKFNKDCGVLKYTPIQSHGINPHHYDFYKEDSFNVGKLILLEMIPLT